MIFQLNLFQVPKVDMGGCEIIFVVALYERKIYLSLLQNIAGVWCYFVLVCSCSSLLLWRSFPRHGDDVCEFSITVAKARQFESLTDHSLETLNLSF